MVWNPNQRDSQPEVGSIIYRMKLLFPFAAIFRSLQLERRWWHRLALVGLVLSVLASFVVTLALTLIPDLHDREATLRLIQEAADIQETTTHGPWERYAQITSLPSLPQGFTAVVMLSGNGEKIEFPSDTTKAEMTKALCEHLQERGDKLQQNDAGCWKVISADPEPVKASGQHTADLAVPRLLPMILRDLIVASFVAITVFYLLQLAYRAVIFVIFGRPNLPMAA